MAILRVLYVKYIQGVPNNHQIFHMQVEQTKLSQKVFYHFAIFAIVNKILITKNY